MFGERIRGRGPSTKSNQKAVLERPANGVAWRPGDGADQLESLLLCHRRERRRCDQGDMFHWRQTIEIQAHETSDSAFEMVGLDGKQAARLK